MTSHAARSFLVRLVVVVALGVAGWRFLVSPMHTRVAERRATLDAMRQEINAGSQQMQLETDTPAQVIAELRRRADNLRDLWQVSSDASRLYERFDALAHRYGVTIERMEPRTATSQGSSGPDAEDAPQIAEIAYSIELLGTYDAATRFLHAVQGETGIIRVDSFRVAPETARGPEPIVRVSLRTTHYQVSAGLAAFSESKGVKP